MFVCFRGKSRDKYFPGEQLRNKNRVFVVEETRKKKKKRKSEWMWPEILIEGSTKDWVGGRGICHQKNYWIALEGKSSSVFWLDKSLVFLYKSSAFLLRSLVANQQETQNNDNKLIKIKTIFKRVPSCVKQACVGPFVFFFYLFFFFFWIGRERFLLQRGIDPLIWDALLIFSSFYQWLNLSTLL